MGERHMILNSLELISLTLQYKQPILNYKTNMNNYKELNTSQGLCLFLSNSKLCDLLCAHCFSLRSNLDEGPKNHSLSNLY